MPEQNTAIVTFRLGAQIYGLPIAPVRQIIEMVTITPIPQAHRSIVGVINFHGALAPVINLRTHLALPAAGLELHTPIILVTLSERLIGLIVDQVLDVVELAANQIIEPRKALLQDLGELSLLQGLIFSKEGTILLLDLEHLLSADYARVLLEAAEKLSPRFENETSNRDPEPQAGEMSQTEPDRTDGAAPESSAAPAEKTKPRGRKKAVKSQETPNEAAA